MYLVLLMMKCDVDVPLFKIDRSVKFAQQLLNWIVVFPDRPLMLLPLEFFRLAVTVSVVTPTETQLPCKQQQQAEFQLYHLSDSHEGLLQ